MSNDILHFPVYALFIGANFAFASLTFIQTTLESRTIKWSPIWSFAIIYMLLVSALLCIFSSNLFGIRMLWLARMAGILLAISYLLLSLIPILLRKKHEIIKAKGLIKATEPAGENLEERFEELLLRE